MQQKRYIIAVDGYSSCGKSTFAKAIAKRLGYIFIDTGAMYRAVTLAALRANVAEDRRALNELLPSIGVCFEYNEARGVSEVYLNGECVDAEIRSMEVSRSVSQVSANEAVRTKLVAMQQAMGDKGGVVMDGRDIGTVVFPNAEIKIYMQADPTIRAIRRHKELAAKGEELSLEEIVANVEARDRADETREISPLRRADDAHLLDNSEMSVEEQMEWFDTIYNRL